MTTVTISERILKMLKNRAVHCEFL